MNPGRPRAIDVSLASCPSRRGQKGAGGIPPRRDAVRGIGGYLPNYHLDLPPHERKPPLETVRSAQPEADARKLLAAFLPKAFRREIAPEEVEPYVALLQSRLAAQDCFEDTMRRVYVAVLTSPEFRFHSAASDDQALASRLSHWLWNGPPDELLLAKARDGSLTRPELLQIFRETPEFGRSLATCVDPFLDESTKGHLRLVGGGGEAIVFGDPEKQLAVKLLAPPGKARFGWVFGGNDDAGWAIRGGGLAEAVVRFAWFESLFGSGLELDQVGTAGDFLVLRQPFIEGGHPDEPPLSRWMTEQGWTRWSPPTELDMIANLTWRRYEWIATDVRPENTLLAEAGGVIRAIDFIVGRV
jgi:hypothetical protein